MQLVDRIRTYKEEKEEKNVCRPRSHAYRFFAGASMRGLFRERVYHGVYRFWFAAEILLAMSH